MVFRRLFSFHPRIKELNTSNIGFGEQPVHAWASLSNTVFILLPLDVRIGNALYLDPGRYLPIYS